ncbi:hypothetical protein Lser_V15G10602 [Lactuca serriola]
MPSKTRSPSFLFICFHRLPLHLFSSISNSCPPPSILRRPLWLLSTTGSFNNPASASANFYR